MDIRFIMITIIQKILRVVDASSFPDMISGNINASVIMLAEKASDMILKN